MADAAAEGRILRRWCRSAAVAACAAAVPLAGAWARWCDLSRAQRAWSRCAARAVGLDVSVRGEPPPGGVLLAANHVGYLDILALGAVAPGRFLAKAEIAGWGLVGALARWGGAVFLQRDRPRDVRAAVDRVAALLAAGERVILFPEAGVSPDARLGPFRPMLFEAAVRSGRPVVPVGLRYREPADPRAWAWIEEPSLARHLWTRVLPARRIRVEVVFGGPIPAGAGADRKILAARARSAVAEILART